MSGVDPLGLYVTVIYDYELRTLDPHNEGGEAEANVGSGRIFALAPATPKFPHPCGEASMYARYSVEGSAAAYCVKVTVKWSRSASVHTYTLHPANAKAHSGFAHARITHMETNKGQPSGQLPTPETLSASHTKAIPITTTLFRVHKLSDSGEYEYYSDARSGKRVRSVEYFVSAGVQSPVRLGSNTSAGAFAYVKLAVEVIGPTSPRPIQ